MKSNESDSKAPISDVAEQTPPKVNGDDVCKPDVETDNAAPHAPPALGEAESTEKTATHVVRLNGLPYTISENEIRAFFRDFELSEDDPILFFTEGQHRGTGFVRLRHAADVTLAIDALHRQHIDANRYVELSASSDEDRQQAVEQHEASSRIHVLRLRGLPFASTEENVREFVSSVAGVTRIDISRDMEGRNTGDAFIELATDDDVEQAKLLDKKPMGNRYIEVLASTVYDREAIMRAASLRARRDRRTQQQQQQQRGGGGVGRGAMPMMPPGFMDPFLAAYMGYMPSVFGGGGGGGDAQQQQLQQQQRGGRGGQSYNGANSAALFQMFPGQQQMMAPRAPSAHVVRVRGLPYAATEESIAEFFVGVKIPSQGVHMVFNEQNRPTGEAFVELEDDTDVKAALAKNGGAMGTRYIEVFQSSAAAMQRLGNPYAGMMGMMPYAMPGLGMIPQMYY